MFCTGKIYFDLLEEREKQNLKNVAIVRIEQLAPFPWDKVAEQVKLYRSATDVIWAQEEPKNIGAWMHVEPRIATATRTLNRDEVRVEYVGRKPSAATATGLGSRAHNFEQESIVKNALAAGTKPTMF